MEKRRLQESTESRSQVSEEVIIMAKAKTEVSQLMFKTRGWAVRENTFADVLADADFSCFTLSGRFAWAETQHTELLGTALKEQVIYPQGWSIQEFTPPYGYSAGLIKTGDSQEIGMPIRLNIHDLWTTVPMNEEMFRRAVGYYEYNVLGPSFRPLPFDNAGQIGYLDFEQVVAAQSREFAPDFSAMGPDAIKADPSVRVYPLHLTFANQWGSAEPIASQDIYHTRIMVLTLDLIGAAGTGAQPSPTTGWFVQVPPSNQPMVTILDQPSFIERVTMERRSKAV